MKEDKIDSLSKYLAREMIERGKRLDPYEAMLHARQMSKKVYIEENKLDVVFKKDAAAENVDNSSSEQVMMNDPQREAIRGLLENESDSCETSEGDEEGTKEDSPESLDHRSLSKQL